MKRGAKFIGNSICRLARDSRGNVLAISAAALIPTLGILGGALDLTRGYLVKSRLQHACDAAVLAGRRTMVGNSFEGVPREAANSFFTANFKPGRFGSRDSAISYQVGNDLIVHGHATSVVPTAVMKIFNIAKIDVSVNCDAKLQLPNSDVMFVLDTTRSMLETNAGDAKNRLAALRDSVVSFVQTLEGSKSPGTQVRYGFVPYSSTVNVGLLLKPEWVVDTADYQSRVPDTVEEVSAGTEGETITTSTNYSAWTGTKTTTTFAGSPENCVAPANEGYSDSTVYTAWNSATRPRSRTGTRTLKGTSYSADPNASNGCTITKNVYNNYEQTFTQTETDNPKAGQSKGTSKRYWWNYKSIPYDVRALKNGNGSDGMSGGSFTAQVADNHALRTISWNATAGACIEERATRRTNGPNSDPEYDLDVDLVPNSAIPATQWRPFLPGLVYGRSNTGYTATSGWGTPTNVVRQTTNYLTPNGSPLERGACPTASRKLKAMTQSEVLTYVNSLKAAGFTYHDVGFLWGLRMMSPNGIFAADNKDPSTGSVARHLIFMTDGKTETKFANYDAYGFSAIDRRRTDPGSVPTDAQQDAIVAARLQRLCAIAKNQKNITVWVIAFGTSLNSMLTDCASPNRAFQANNAAELNATFADIAAQISQLRLVK